MVREFLFQRSSCKQSPFKKDKLLKEQILSLSVGPRKANSVRKGWPYEKGDKDFQIRVKYQLPGGENSPL